MNILSTLRAYLFTKAGIFFSLIRKARTYSGTFLEKISILFILIRLRLKTGSSNKLNTEVQESFLGYQFSAYDYATIEFLFNEIFISNEYYFQPTSETPFIIDCGANIGMSVLYFSKLFPNSKIVAFEANPHAFRLLEKNVRDNRLDKVELHNRALYHKETEISFYIGDNVGTLIGSINQNRGGSTEMKIQTKVLSDYLKNFETVDLVKMDVEGAELNIISDLFETGSINKVKEYIIEYHHNINQDKSVLSSFLNKFETNGFNYCIKANFSTIRSFQDILIHFYKN